MHQYQKDLQEMEAWMAQASKEEIHARAAAVLDDLCETLRGIGTEDQIINLQPALNFLLSWYFRDIDRGAGHFTAVEPVLSLLHGGTLFGVPVVVNRIHNLHQMPETPQ